MQQLIDCSLTNILNKKVTVLSIQLILGDMELGVDKLPTLLASQEPIRQFEVYEIKLDIKDNKLFLTER